MVGHVVCVWGGGWVGGGTSYHPVTLYSYLYIDICVVCVWGGGCQDLRSLVEKMFYFEFQINFFQVLCSAFSLSYACRYIF